LVVTAVFFILWIVVGFLACRYVTRFYFHEPRRADVASIGIVAAFALGAIWPFSQRVSAGDAALSVPGGVAAAANGGAARVAPPPRLAAAPTPPSEGPPAACKTGPTTLREGGTGWLDQMHAGTPPALVSSGQVVSSHEKLWVQGWAADRSMSHPSYGVCLIVDGRVDGPVNVTRVQRQDVVDGFHSEGVRWTGFTIEIPPGSLHSGKRKIQVAALSPDGSLSLLEGKRDVIVQ